MSRAATTLRHQALHGAVALLLAQVGIARADAVDKPPPLPEQVTLAHQQYERLTAAFAIWRTGDFASPSETLREAAIRKAVRLRVVPTPTPLLATQRRMDGHAIVVSLGLVVLLDELLLAEATSPGCFEAYAGEVEGVLEANRKAAQVYAEALDKATQTVPAKEGLATDSKAQPVRALPATPVNAWPRFSGRIGKARTGCENVKPAALHSSATRAWLANNADSLALWLLTHQTAVLAQDPAIEAPAPKPASAPAPAPATKPARAGPPTSPDPSMAKTACLKEIAAAAEAASAAWAASAPMPDSKPTRRADLALCTTERNDGLRTLAWLRQNLPLLGAVKQPRPHL